MTDVTIALYRGRVENEISRTRQTLDTVPRQGEFIHHDGQLFEIRQVTWDFSAEPPVAAVVGSLSLGGVRL